MQALACAPVDSSVAADSPRAAAVWLGIDPAVVVDLESTGLAAVPRSDGHVSIVTIHRVSGDWAASTLTTSPGVVGGDSLHVVSYGGATGEPWNTFVFGTAAPGTERVELPGFPDQRGGEVVHGVWVIALRQKDLQPADITWRFVNADGSSRTGTGIFPPDA